MTAGAVLVGLLREHDLVDEAGGLAVGWRLPRQLDAGELALQPLQQAHEVPNGKDVPARVQAQVVDIGERGEQRVPRHARARRRDRGRKLGEPTTGSIVDHSA
jgi:hypothetical protein